MKVTDAHVDHKRRIWRTADGREYQIRQMETSHIQNSLRKIEREWPTFRPHMHKPLLRELFRRSLNND